MAFKTTVQPDRCNRIVGSFQPLFCIAKPCVVKVLIEIPMEDFGTENQRYLTIGEVEIDKNYAMVIFKRPLYYNNMKLLKK